MLLEYAGLCLTRDTSQQLFLILCGMGGTGKSVLIRLIESAAGAQNVSNVSMHELNKRFSTSLLVGKALNEMYQRGEATMSEGSKAVAKNWNSMSFMVNKKALYCGCNSGAKVYNKEGFAQGWRMTWEKAEKERGVGDA